MPDKDKFFFIDPYGPKRRMERFTIDAPYDWQPSSGDEMRVAAQMVEQLKQANSQ